MEAAIAIASIVAVVVTCIGAVMAVSMHIRCVDGAREAARSVARGGEVSDAVIPDGAVVTLSEDGGFVTARVQSATALPGLTVSAEAVAAVEPE
ncbi:TadE family type IV pilus minor pilin [Rhodococcus sp. G-MC3]|uniref:TadE family type IV pilus minor pilin n=1 Tax=Rhodococcus sp. G-MC3 TaxID=3046209 RepID=UPI0024BA8DCB|nr:TadE family type IV pilus minor pilin [Rhodococcus sp. G-MC3]MDJ0393509.1 TadE family type IV pilus minor pilin [Rhodococcus sp. G-MC3]